MKKILFILLLFIPLNVMAMSKDDLLNYVSSYEDEICDSYTLNLYQNYKVLYERMLKERDLSNEEINEIYQKLSSAINLITENDLCKKDDLKTISSDIKKEIKSLLYDGAMIIYNANDISGDSTDNALKIDSDNNTVTIYKNGYVYDEVNIGSNVLNEVGPSKIVIIILLINIFLIILNFIFIKKKYKYQNLFKAIIIQNIIIFLIVIINANNINKAILLFNNFKYVDGSNIQEIVVNDKQIVTYPSIGYDYGKLNIPSLDISLDIYFGDNTKILNKGIGHTSSSYFPGEGGTIIYSTHNTYLNNINKLKKNSEIVIETTYGKFTYKVNKTDIINKNSTINIKDNKETLVLYTCYPISNVIYGNKRYIIYASLEKSEWY